MTTTEATTQAPAGYVLRMVDPRSIIDNPDNTRKPKANREGLAASIKALGILTPPLVWELADGTLRLIAGERRKYSAIAAGLDTIPVYVRNDLSPVQQVAGMLVENMDRESLSTVEEACAIQQLAGFEGMSTKAITEMTGLKAAQVRQAIKVAESEVASAVTERFDLSLDQAAVVAEFQDDREAVKALTLCAREEPGQFKHLASQLREQRKENAERAAVVAALEADGLVVIEAPAWGYDGPIARLSSLVDDKGRDITEKAHAKCPGHAVALNRWSTDRHDAYCLDPAANGHALRRPQASGSPSGTAGGGMTDEQKAERREVVENNRAWKAAEVVRREHVTELLARRSVPKDTLRIAVTDCLTHPDRLSADDALLATLTGRTVPKNGFGHQVGPKVVADAPDNRLALALLAQVATAIEAGTGTHTWRHVDARVAAWFTYLVSTGYTLSAVEQLVVDKAKKGGGR